MASGIPDPASESRHNQTPTKYNLEYKEIPNCGPLRLTFVILLSHTYQAAPIAYNIEWKMRQKVEAQDLSI